MTRIDQIWKELESDPSLPHGILYRRYSAAILPDVFIAWQNPEKIRCIAVFVNADINLRLTEFSNLKDINVELKADESEHRRKILFLRLINRQHSNIFSVLCEDLIASVAGINNENQLVKELFNRFIKWKSLFDKASQQGLTAEEQRGLYGELYFLRQFLQVSPDFLYTIQSWVGPEKQIKDFQYHDWSVEVKTTHGNNHQKIHVNSERQLDTSGLNHLFLYHISLETKQQAGETLNHIVRSISDILAQDMASYNRFRIKLLEAGYFDGQNHIYDYNGYIIRQECFYKVENTFPRIEEADVRNGVGDVKYSIIASQFSEYSVSRENVFKVLLLP
jgi:hypothetical protein